MLGIISLMLVMSSSLFSNIMVFFANRFLKLLIHIWKIFILVLMYLIFDQLISDAIFNGPQEELILYLVKEIIPENKKSKQKKVEVSI